MKVYKIKNTESNKFWNGVLDINSPDFDLYGMSFTTPKQALEDFEFYTNEICNTLYCNKLKSVCKFVEYELIENEQFDLKLK